MERDLMISRIVLVDNFIFWDWLFYICEFSNETIFRYFVSILRCVIVNWNQKLRLDI